ncbi:MULTISPECIES: phage portal protein [Clostridium]|uniref:phage portal protein n=1 Tax=Clostridium TaxID=1485 RepID=UPI000774696C|nr:MULTISPECIES: phage portal protein [Clostridium]AUM96157.1 portal protein [Clostridium sporogenes]AVQ53610.1 phage portal protein [Clostridium botulinum]
MGLKSIWNKIKKGVKAGIMATKESNSLTDNKVVLMINDFSNSEKRNWMTIGDRYYKVENDIFKRKITRIVKGTEVEETYKANNKLAHSKYKNMVDEKVAYLLSKDYALKCDDESYVEKVKDVLGKHFQYQLSGLGYEASNKGIAWLQAYIDEEGKFRTMIIPSEQCIPIWRDNSHTELESMIRVYETVVWEYDKKKTITNVEVWGKDGVSYYRLEGKLLIADYDKNNDNNGPVAHYRKGDMWYAWGRVPFIAFKNNRIELPDIKFVKSLADNYDLSRSEAANYVEEVKNLIFILKGYGGEDIHEFMRVLNEDRAIPIDDPEDGGVDTLTPQMDITALREHYEQLKRDLTEDGQSINKDLDKFGSAPSGVALKFMYSGLDLKCNALESEFKMGFENLLYFINIYLSENSLGSYKNVDLDIIFNRDMKINESEVIENCEKSKGVVSDDTIIANHPWTKDIEQEKEALEKQKQENLPFQDKIPIGGGVDEE